MPFAILFGRGLLEYFRCNRAKIFDITAKIMMILLIVAAFGFAIFQIIANRGACDGLYRPNELWKWVSACAAALVWAFALFKTYKAKAYRAKLCFLLAGPILVFFLSHFIAPDFFLEGKAQGEFLEQFKGRVKPGMILVVHPNMMHAAAWVFKNKDMLFYTHGGELEVGLKYKDSRNRIISNQQLKKLLKTTPPGKIIFIMRGDFREGIPAAGFEKYEHEIMFSNF
jgi:hypothetical protein